MGGNGTEDKEVPLKDGAEQITAESCELAYGFLRFTPRSQRYGLRSWKGNSFCPK
jgi:hypothetical protein